MKIHTLKNGITVALLSPGHGAKFSDGSECGPQEKALCDQFGLENYEEFQFNRLGSDVVRAGFRISQLQADLLAEIASQVDWLIVPFVIIEALHRQGLRNQPRFINVVSFYATPETKRSAPADKIIDITKWAW